MIPVRQVFFGKHSGEIARRRLKLLLVSDRAGCSPELLEMIQGDFLHCISRYLEIDAGEVTLHVIRSSPEEYRGRVPAICASIPILDLRK